jgi:hypothetical protein
MDEIGDRRMGRSESPGQFSATADQFLHEQETLDDLDRRSIEGWA